jgi:hypothetical protein
MNILQLIHASLYKADRGNTRFVSKWKVLNGIQSNEWKPTTSELIRLQMVLSEKQEKMAFF